MYLDVGSALPEIESAIALAPGDAAVQSYYGSFQGLLGRPDAALVAIRRAIARSWTRTIDTSASHLCTSGWVDMERRRRR